MSIRKRLLLLVFVVWFPAAAGFGLFAWYAQEEEAAATRRQVEQYALRIATVIERELDKRVVLGHALAASRGVRDGDLARFHQEASNATVGTGSWVLLVDPRWQLLNTRAPFPAEPVARARPMALTQAAPAIVFVPFAPVARTSAITVFVPIAGETPQRHNVGVSFEPAVLQGILEANPAPFGALTVVADGDQIIMARSRDPGQWFGKSASPAFRQRILADGVGFAESTTLDGVRSMTYLTPRSAYHWSVVVSVPVAQLQHVARQASVHAVTAAAVLLVFGLVLALFGARRIGRTVDDLRHAAVELGDNRLPALLHTGVREVDEVGHALHAAGVKAQQANEVLAQRVKQAVEQAEQAQAKLLQSQKLELVGRLTAGVAHDFNNLLQTIATAQHLLERRIADGPERRALDGARRAVFKARDLVKQLMTFGRVQTLEPAVFGIADVVLKSQELTRAAVGKGIELDAVLAPHLPDVYVDAVQFEMALLNLVFNARDALPAGGRITISAREATPQEGERVGPGRFVCLEVADDGTGMSEEVQARAFEPYFTTKPVGSGSGIGLAQVHAFARQSGGDISLSSAPGRGTRVLLLLPVAPEGSRPAPQEPAAAASTLRTPMRLLMVEDDVLVSSVVGSALQEEGYAVRLCNSADDAVALLQTGAPFDLVFTDVVMPGRMNGLDLARWCAAERPGLPVVVTTGYAEKLDTVSANVLRKPYAIDMLVETLEAARSRASSTDRT